MANLTGQSIRVAIQRSGVSTLHLPPSSILSFSLLDGASGGLLLGRVLGNVCTLRCTAGANESFLGAWAQVFLCSGQSETPLCSFFINDAKRTPSGIWTLSGSGLSGTFEIECPALPDFPLTAGALIAFCANCADEEADCTGFTGSNLLFTQRPDTDGMTIRQVLSLVLGASGGFAMCAPEGGILVRDVKNTPSGILIPASQSLAVQYPQQAFGPLCALVHEEGESAVLQGQSPNASNTLSIAKNPLLAESGKVGELLSRLQGLLLQKGSVTHPLGASILPGEQITLQEGQMSLPLYVAQRQITAKGGSVTETLSCDVSCTESGILSGYGSILSTRSLRGRISGAQIYPGTISSDALSAGSVTANAIQSAAVTAEKLSAGSVTTLSLASGSVTADKIAAGSVTANALSAGSVTANHLAAGAVTADKIAAGQIDASHIAAHTLTAGQLETNLICAGSALLQDGCITSAKIADLSVTDGKILSLSADKLTAGTLDASEITVCNLCADNITTGTLNGQRIPQLGSEKLASGAVTGEKIAQNAVSSTHLAASSVTADKLSANAVTADKILSQAVTADKLAAGSITASHIAAHSLTADCLSAGVGAALDLSSNTTVRARVLDCAGITIGQAGVDIEGASVSVATDDMEICGKASGDTLLHITPAGIEGDTLIARQVISPSLVGVCEGGQRAAEGQIGEILTALPRYIQSDLNITIPAGTYRENLTLQGFFGAKITLSFASNALLQGSIAVKNCASPVVLSGGQVLAGGDYCIQADNCASLTVSGMKLFGRERDAQDASVRTFSGIELSGCKAKIQSCVISRVTEAIRALYGTVVCVSGCEGGEAAYYECICTASNYAYLRSQASASYTTLANVPGGTVLRMVSPDLVNGNYYQVIYNSQTGYLSSTVVGSISPVGGDVVSNANLGCAIRSEELSRVYVADTCPGGNLADVCGDGSAICGTFVRMLSAVPAPAPAGDHLTHDAIACYVQRADLDDAPRNDLQPRQGAKCIWILSDAALIAHETFTEAYLTLSRQGVQGGQSEEIHLYGHGCGSDNPSEMPALTDLQLTAVLSPWQQKTIQLPGRVVSMLQNGTILGFAVSDSGNEASLSTEMRLILQ